MSILVTFQGTVGQDPELKFTKADKPFTVLSVAHTDRVKQGETWVDGETTWIRVVMFGERSETIVDSVSKGDKVLVTGNAKLNTFTNKEGIEKTALECSADTIAVVPKRKQTNKRNEDIPNW